MGIREDRKAATLQAIHAAALELVESHCLDSVTVGQIAARAGVSERDDSSAIATPGKRPSCPPSMS